MDQKSQEKYLICPVCFSLYSLDKYYADSIMECEHCEGVEVLPLEEFLYYSSVASLEELKEEFNRSNHLEADTKDMIINNLRILIQVLEEVK